MSVLVDSVAKAVELLDKDYPGWFLAIATEDLWMEDPSRCILGQLYGGYNKGTTKLLGEYYRAPLGWPFVELNCATDPPTSNKTEWLKVIAARREAFLKQSVPAKKERVEGKQEYRKLDVEFPRTLEDAITLFGTKEIFRVFTDHLIRKALQDARRTAKAFQPLIDELNAQEHA